MSRLASSLDLLTCGLGFMLLAAPLALMPFSFNGNDGLNEKRKLAEAPGLPSSLDETKAFPKAFEAWFNDHFQLRGDLIGLNNKIRMKLGQSPNKNIVVGTDGWLFLGNADRCIDEWRGADPFKEAELKSWSTAFQQRQQWAEAHGITYLFFMPPDKQTMYPENMPSRLYRPGARTRLDALNERLTRDVPDVFINAQAHLEANRSWHRMYEKTDSHWTDAGSFVLYEEIIRRLQAEGLQTSPTFPREKLTIVTDTTQGGDLAVFAGVQDWMLETREHLSFDPVTAGLPVSSNVKVLLLHDSFGGALMPHLKRHFGSIADEATWDFDPAKILADKPQVIIQEMTERTLFKLTPLGNHPEVASFREAAETSRNHRL
ncbi:MAG: hypothetical protein H7249_19095 [Chitinophagaceae bacterium]|nr:hypothetical protein [Oligoflexus sp.]